MVANSAPDPSDQIAISTRAINARAKAAFANSAPANSAPVIYNLSSDSEDRDFDQYGCNRGATTEDDGEDFRAQQRQIFLNNQVSCAQPRDDDEVEPPLEQICTIFGVEGILQAFKGSKPRPEVKPRHSKRFWFQVGRAPQPDAASAHFKDRYPVRRGRCKRDHGDMVKLLSDNCSDESAEEEAEESDRMIDDTDTEEDYAEFAQMMARQAARKVARAEKKAAKAAKKAAKRAKKA